jgi:hypothetical protein
LVEQNPKDTPASLSLLMGLSVPLISPCERLARRSVDPVEWLVVEPKVAEVEESSECNDELPWTTWGFQHWMYEDCRQESVGALVSVEGMRTA